MSGFSDGRLVPASCPITSIALPRFVTFSQFPDACSRFLRLVGGLLVLSFGLLACDSNGGGPPPSDLEGTYAFTRFEFTVAGVDDFNVLEDTLVTASNSPRMEFFGGNATVNLIYRVEGSPATSLISGRFTTGRGQVTADFSSASEADRFELLLPQVVRFQTEGGNERLVANQKVNDVDLRAYAPGRYRGLTQNVNGTLRLRLERVQP